MEGQLRIRRRYLVNKQFQLGYTGIILAAQCLVALTVALTVSWFYLFVMDRRMICDHNSAFFWHLWITILVVTVFLIVWSIRYTHSIAGFVRKLSIVLREASEGKIPDTPVHFRKKDPFGWLAADLSACLKTMEGYRMDRGNALAALEVLEEKARAGELPDKECIKVVQAIIKQMNGRNI